ncbi:dehydrogenase [Macrococcoides goetzii]|uniref:Dehydrogenase n=1 Tax=Macrococcoides goetzii TaxID=1891097 RepID=A0A395G8G6_9STAP|nr:bi-domain-containing oxidoreductase [Macrococcus goetzii]RAI79923.1 dehydrogenase [Macrococcus goetzii]
MKQLLNSLSDGEIKLKEVPKPLVGKNEILIKTHYSAISIGTEKMLVDFGKANYIKKAKQQPEKVKEVINKVKTDGISTTYNAVKSKLDKPIPLGYSSAGEVIEIGDNVKEFRVGDFVISNGSHAEVVAVNKNLAAKIPSNVKLEDAAFTVISSIPLQGIRLLEPQIGETIVVIGLGLMGLIASQILVANGCTVIGTDVDEKKIELAKSYGINAVNVGQGFDIVNYVKNETNGFGADKVLITASTKSNEPILQSANMVRQRGKIVLVGVVGLDIDRTPFYEKEITFQVSSSYGPGRYDKQYESDGIDYPYGYVRWTENRNFRAILKLMEKGSLTFDNLITHKLNFTDASQVYTDISKESNVIGALFKYDAENTNLSVISHLENNSRIKHFMNEPTIGLIGAGNYTNQTLLPKINKKYRLKTIGSPGGMNASFVGEKHGFESATSNIDLIFEDSEINTLLITTRHDSHASLVRKGLHFNKSIFVEKPLAISNEDLEKIEEEYNGQHLMVGFNRRFSPITIKMKTLLSKLSSPKNIVIEINAGKIPKDHWTQDEKIGGGRLVGEACHFIDLAMFLAESKIIKYEIVCMDTIDETNDTFSILLKFEDGSIATINYNANGDKSYPKEIIKVTCENKILENNNFKILKGYGFKNFKTLRSAKQDKGHEACINLFLESVSSEKALIPFDDLVESARIAIELDKKMRGANEI